MNYEVQLKEWDAWIRQGQGTHVRALCRKLNHKKIPRKLLVEYAQVARRVGAPELIILWLSSVVRSEKALQRPATDPEKAVYALGLLRLGAFREASQILADVDAEADPQIYFYRASMNLNQWNYKKALPDLKRYSCHLDVPVYSRLVGRLNLCAALVSTQKFKAAEKQIARLMRILDRQKVTLLKGNLLEIRSQLLLELSLPVQAMADLEEAQALLNTADERSRLYVDKWRLIIQLKGSETNSELLAQLQDLKQQALQIKDWESARDCDLHRALALKDPKLLLRVYWGSKFLNYKKRILKSYGYLQVPDLFQWESHPGQSSEVSKIEVPRIDLVSSAPTALLKKLFFILTRDFYQPHRTTEILDALYSSEYYHPVASPAKLQRLIARAREWLDSCGFPIEIVSTRNSFHLHFHAPCVLLLHRDFRMVRAELMAQITEQAFFDVAGWAKERSVSPRTARRQIHNLVKAGKIEMKLRGPKTVYRLKTAA